jgi:hypothetical protein
MSYIVYLLQITQHEFSYIVGLLPYILVEEGRILSNISQNRPKKILFSSRLKIGWFGDLKFKWQPF